MSTKQTASKRPKAILSALSSSGARERLHDDAKGFASDLTTIVKEILPMYRPSDELDLDDPVVHGYIASAALSIAAVGDPLVEKGFEQANLDPKNPLSWRILFDWFCWVYFGTKKKRGAPKKSDTRRYCQLLRDFDRKRRDPSFP